MPAMNGVELPSAPPTPAGKLRSAEMQAAQSTLSAHLTDGPSRRGPAQLQGRIDPIGSGIGGLGSVRDLAGPSEQVGGKLQPAPTERPLPVFNPTPTPPSDFAPSELAWPSAVVQGNGTGSVAGSGFASVPHKGEDQSDVQWGRSPTFMDKAKDIGWNVLTGMPGIGTAASFLDIVRQEAIIDGTKNIAGGDVPGTEEIRAQARRDEIADVVSMVPGVGTASSVAGVFYDMLASNDTLPRVQIAPSHAARPRVGRGEGVCC